MKNFFEISIPLIIIFLIFLKINNNRKNKLNLQKIINRILGNDEIYSIKKSNSSYDYLIEGEKYYLVKVIKMSMNKKLSINSKYYFEIQQSFSSQIGQESNGKKRIKGIEKFQKLKYTSEKPVIKVIAVIPGNVTIYQYLNESEIIIVKDEPIIHNFQLWRL